MKMKIEEVRIGDDLTEYLDDNSSFSTFLDIFIKDNGVVTAVSYSDFKNEREKETVITMAHAFERGDLEIYATSKREKRFTIFVPLKLSKFLMKYFI